MDAATIRDAMVAALERHGLASLEFRDACLVAAQRFSKLGIKREAAAAYLSAGHVEERRNNTVAAIQLFREAVRQDWRWLTAWSVMSRHEGYYAEERAQAAPDEAYNHYRRAWRGFRIAARLARKVAPGDAAYYERQAASVELELQLLGTTAH